MLPSTGRGGKRLASPRHTPPFRLIRRQQRLQPLNDRHLLGGDVLRLARVVAEVVELDRREVLLPRRGLAQRPAAGAAAENQLPVPLSDREGPFDGVVYRCLADRTIRRPEIGRASCRERV